MTFQPEHIRGSTTHTRRGDIRHKFCYGVDFVLIDAEEQAALPSLFSRNRFNLTSVHDVDHGGPWKDGTGAAWTRNVLRTHGLDDTDVKILLLTQPRYLGFVFNPVSFWMAYRADDLVAVIAEVSTPFKDRHSYLCHAPDFAPITSETRITKPKALHVSPFQEIKGSYGFTFDIRPDRIAISILHKNNKEGVIATLSGKREPMTSAGLLAASLRRPMGPMRTVFLIYWQALRLKLKGATYRTRPAPPKTEVN
ncbi:DUF1365 domain-containing protein [Falsihalocynthiibacter sp. SS001]|uniref:DUF1365 domain-containing protein n=1 Tax=Falsihalocynthiibacter sp. SS001 TaxID=3349698 RepID=UPI0036D35FA5